MKLDIGEASTQLADKTEREKKKEEKITKISRDL